MGAEESVPRRISMQEDDMSGISVTQSVVKNFGDLPEGVEVASGTGLTVEFTSGRKYIDFDEVHSQLTDLEEKLARKKDMKFNFTGLEFLSEAEHDSRTVASDLEEEQAIEEGHRRAEADARLMQQQGNLDEALREVEQRKREEELKFQQREELVRSARSMEENVALEELQQCQASVLERDTELSRQRLESEARTEALRIAETELEILRAAVMDQTHKQQELESLSLDCNVEYQQLTSDLASSQEEQAHQQASYEGKIASLETMVANEQEACKKQSEELSSTKEELGRQVDGFEKQVKLLNTIISSEKDECKMHLSDLASDQQSVAEELHASQARAKQLEGKLQAEQDKFAQMASDQGAASVELEASRSRADELELQVQAEKDNYKQMALNQHTMAEELEGSKERAVRLEQQIQDEKDNYSQMFCDQQATATELEASQARARELEIQLQTEKEEHLNMLNGRGGILRNLREKHVESVKSMIRPLQTAPICEQVQADVLACYRSNKNAPLRCSREVQAYIDCVQSRRLELLQQKAVR